MKLRFVLVPLAIVAMAFSLTGCGTNGGDDDPTQDPSNTSTAEPGGPSGSQTANSTDDPNNTGSPDTNNPGSVNSTNSNNNSNQPGSTTAKPGSTTAKPGSTTAKPGSTTAKPGSTTAKPGSTTAGTTGSPSNPGSTQIASNWPATWPGPVPKMPGTIDYSKDNGISNDPGIQVMLFVNDKKMVENYVGALQGAGFTRTNTLGSIEVGAYMGVFKGKGYVVHVSYDATDAKAMVDVTTKNA